MRQDFYGDVAAQLLVMRAKNYTHAAGPDLFDQTVMSQNLANRNRWR